MECTCANEPPRSEMITEAPCKTTQGIERRSADYKPNIWKYDLIQSLKSEYNEEKYSKHAQKMKEEILCVFVEIADPLAKLELIDSIEKLGLGTLFEEEIKGALETIASLPKESYPTIEGNLYGTALLFRLLRHHGWNVSQDMFVDFMDNSGRLAKSTHLKIKAILELFEASSLALEGENILEEAKFFTTIDLKSISSKLHDKLAKQVNHALELPSYQRVEWYNVWGFIQDYEKEDNANATLLKLAKLNFNMVQATHQEDLKEITRWWRNLGITESLSFSRNRIVESFLWSVGVAFEPQYRNLRKWLTKVIKLVLVIDDVYDIYGSLQELELFTSAVDRWDFEGTQTLPECMKICLKTLYDTASETASEIQEEKGWISVLPHLQKGWSNFCKALLAEAKWYNMGYTPSLQEYLDNGWISSCGPLLSLHVAFSVTSGAEVEAVEFLQNNQDLIYYSSLIIRLCNDQGTSAVELERGDAPTSIQCFKREAAVSEEVARKHIKSIISDTMKKISHRCSNQSESVRCIMNIARVAHFIYQNGDGFGVQDRETRDQVLVSLVEPIPLP